MRSVARVRQQRAAGAATRCSSRPKRLITAREDRREDGLPTVVADQVVAVVGIRDAREGAVAPSLPGGAGPSWSCRCSWRSPVIGVWTTTPHQGSTPQRLIGSSWDLDTNITKRVGYVCVKVYGLATPSLQRAVVHASIQQLRWPLAEKASFPKRGRWTPRPPRPISAAVRA